MNAQLWYECAAVTSHDPVDAQLFESLQLDRSRH